MRHRMNDMLKYISIFAVTVMVTAADVYSSGIVSSDNLSGSLPGISIDGDINPVSGTVEGDIRFDITAVHGDTLHEIRFLLGANAFRSLSTKFAKEHSDEYMFRILHGFLKNSYCFETDITGAEIDGINVDAKPFSKGSFPDSTMYTVPIEQPLQGGENVKIKLDFRSKLGKFRGNSGVSSKFVVSGDWFPLPARFEDGVWYGEERSGPERQTGAPAKLNCALTLPSEWNLIATGNRIQMKSDDEGRISYSFTASKTAEFGWVAFRKDKFEEKNGMAGDMMFRFVHSKTWSGARVENAEREIVRNLSALNLEFGPSPFDGVNIFILPTEGEGDVFGNLVILPKDKKKWSVQLCRVYTRGGMAPLIYDDGWLDIGLAAFIARDLDRKYYPNRNDFHIPGRVISGICRWKHGIDAVADSVIHEFNHQNGTMLSEPATIRDNSFIRSASRRTILFMTALRNRIGEKAFHEGLKAYFTNHEFRGSRSALLAEMQKSSGDYELEQVFDYWISSRDLPDYGLSDIEIERSGDTGDNVGDIPVEVSDEGDDETTVNELSEKEEKPYKTVVEIERFGDLVTPVELRVGFRDGSWQSRLTGGSERLFTEEFNSVSPPTVVQLDPDDVTFDADRRNNYDPQPMHLRLAIPGCSSPPRDSYYLSIFPTLWKNERDGFLGGMIGDLSYMDDYDRTLIWLGYGTESKRTHFMAEEIIPFHGLTALGREGAIHIKGGLLEGRAVASVLMQKERRSSWWLRTSLGIGYSEGVDSTWYEPGTWSSNQDIYFNSNIEGGIVTDIADASLMFGYKDGLAFLDSGYDYKRMDFTFNIDTGNHLNPFYMGFRTFLGTIDGSAPLQSMYRLGGAPPEKSLNRMWAASPGGLPSGVYYYEPGGGGLRAYTSVNSGVEGISSINIATGFTILEPSAGGFGLRTGVFFDAARSYGQDLPEEIRGNFSDFGLVFKLENLKIWGIRTIDFNLPVFANVPGIADGGGSEEWKPRFSFSVKGSLW